jgi:hypothetical protein
MPRLLIPHPQSRSSSVDRIEAEIARHPDGRLSLSYVLTGRIGDIALPAIEAPARRDGLWRHTCFEAFLRAAGSIGYYEFNFAPSTQWAAYRFVSYRAGRSDAAEVNAIPIETQSSADSYTLKAMLGLDRLPSPADPSWQLGLSAVIEDTSGSHSYWALAHPPGTPDFHHRSNFVHELSPRAPS